MPSQYGDPDWLIHDRFGLFIHWGLYAAAARREWVMNHEKTHPQIYRKYFDHFELDLFDPKKLARAAKETGIKHLVITSKRHEGFTTRSSGCVSERRIKDRNLSLPN